MTKSPERRVLDAQAAVAALRGDERADLPSGPERSAYNAALKRAIRHLRNCEAALRTGAAVAPMKIEADPILAGRPWEPPLKRWNAGPKPQKKARNRNRKATPQRADGRLALCEACRRPFRLLQSGGGRVKSQQTTGYCDRDGCRHRRAGHQHMADACDRDDGLALARFRLRHPKAILVAAEEQLIVLAAQPDPSSALAAAGQWLTTRS